MLRISRKKFGGLKAPNDGYEVLPTDNGHIVHHQYLPIASIGTAGSTSDYSGQRYSVYDTGSKKVIMLIRQHSDSKLRAVVLDAGAPSTLNNQYLGFSTAQCNNGSTATIAVSSNTSTQSGLTPTATYYVKDDGSLITDENWNNSYGLTPVKVGKALSPTKLLLT